MNENVFTPLLAEANFDEAKEILAGDKKVFEADEVMGRWGGLINKLYEFKKKELQEFIQTTAVSYSFFDRDKQRHQLGVAGDLDNFAIIKAFERAYYTLQDGFERKLKPLSEDLQEFVGGADGTKELFHALRFIDFLLSEKLDVVKVQTMLEKAEELDSKKEEYKHFLFGRLMQLRDGVTAPNSSWWGGVSMTNAERLMKDRLERQGQTIGDYLDNLRDFSDSLKTLILNLDRAKYLEEAERIDGLLTKFAHDSILMTGIAQHTMDWEFTSLFHSVNFDVFNDLGTGKEGLFGRLKGYVKDTWDDADDLGESPIARGLQFGMDVLSDIDSIGLGDRSLCSTKRKERKKEMASLDDYY